MAAVTVTAKLAVVDVVPAMAIHTARADVYLFLYRSIMTSVAMEFSVRVPEFEIRFIVVECPYQPIVGIMALPAVVP